MADEPRATARPALVAEGVAAVARGRWLLRPTSLAVSTGELLAVIGPSGAGKTTLMRVLAGIREPSAGAVTLGGEPLLQRMTEVGYLPAGDALHDRLSVREAVGYAAALRLPRDMPDDELDARVEAVIEELRLTGKAEQWIGTLSSGERKRAACAVELVGNPAVLLLDEPATGLDPSLERTLMTVLRRVADQGRGVAVVTHATSSLALCDTVAVLGPGGVLRFAGPPAAALEHFGVAAYDEIYDALAEPDGAGGGGDEPVPAAPVSRRRRVPTPAGRGFLSQAALLADRYSRCVVRDRRTFAVLIGQAALIGLCIGAVLPHDVLGRTDLAPFYGVFISFLLLTGSIWAGVVSSAREIVKERGSVEREAASGVRLDSYLASKALVLFPLTLIQVLVMMSVAVMLQPLHEPSTAYGNVLILCVLASWAAVGMGLAVSAVARSADQASSTVPLLLIPQLLFAGAIIPVGVMPAPIRALSVLTFSRWGLAGIGGALHLGQTLSDEVSAVAGYDRSFFSLSPGVAALALLVFAALGFLVAARGVDRLPDG